MLGTGVLDAAFEIFGSRYGWFFVGGGVIGDFDSIRGHAFWRSSCPLRLFALRDISPGAGRQCKARPLAFGVACDR